MENENNIDVRPEGKPVPETAPVPEPVPETASVPEPVPETAPVAETVPVPVPENLPETEIIGGSELSRMLSGYINKVVFNPFLRKLIRNTILTILLILIVLFVFSFFLYIVPGLQEVNLSGKHKLTSITDLRSDQAYKKQILSFSKDIQKISRKFISYTPGQSYLVINTTANRFFLYRNKKLVREGYCSSGSYTRLSTAEGTRHWIFKTPKGKFWIQQKITKPLWVRPDWSFVEEGLPIPASDDQSRFEFGVLGDYAMSLGDGYLIHGTIYKRYLGMPVTHGCVRLNDDDLEAIYNTMNIGSKVYIF